MKSMKTTSILVFTGLVSAAATSAVAQTSDRTKGFVNINVAAQPASQTIDSTFTTPVYGQQAAAATSLVIGGEPMFDIDFGYRVRQNIGVAFGYSSLSSSGPIVGTATVPEPRFLQPVPDFQHQRLVQPDRPQLLRHLPVVRSGHEPH